MLNKPFSFLTSIIIAAVCHVAAARDIHGLVCDPSGEPLIGVSVVVDSNHEQSVVTDVQGRFKITDIPEPCTLTLSYIDCLPQTVNVVDGTDEYNIVMQPAVSKLDEVVVVGYATRRKVDLTDR